MGKGLYRVFSTIVSEISQELTNFGESGSEVSHFIPEPRNFAEVTKLTENIRKPWLKATLKEIKNLINNQSIVVRGDLQNKEMVGYNWSPTASMRTFKYFLTDAAKHKARVHQLDFIGAFL